MSSAPLAAQSAAPLAPPTLTPPDAAWTGPRTAGRSAGRARVVRKGLDWRARTELRSRRRSGPGGNARDRTQTGGFPEAADRPHAGRSHPLPAVGAPTAHRKPEELLQPHRAVAPRLERALPADGISARKPRSGDWKSSRRRASSFSSIRYNSVVRTIYLDGRAPLNDRVKLWYGDSRGHWDGNTLVVEGRNLNEHGWYDTYGNFHSSDLRIEERFTFVGQSRVLRRHEPRPAGVHAALDRARRVQKEHRPRWTSRGRRPASKASANAAHPPKKTSAKPCESRSRCLLETLLACLAASTGALARRAALRRVPAHIRR